ncbi:MAG: DedA family protein [Deltaproteobacteria bacterium]|nr:DedA family protein [Deltaproteobacteria bacterium]
MLHELIKIWFHWVEAWGYWGVFILMAMESSVLPVPSEVVMPPAAFWAAQGKMNFWLVVLAGTAGSYFGSLLNYLAARYFGFPLIKRFGKYLFLPPDKLELASNWVKAYGSTGIFIARFLPVVRHLISIPAGVFKMPMLSFSVATTVGAGLWCFVLSWFGNRVIGDAPELLNSPEDMVRVMKAKLIWFVAAIVILGVLYWIVLSFKKKPKAMF